MVELATFETLVNFSETSSDVSKDSFLSYFYELSSPLNLKSTEDVLIRLLVSQIF